MSDAKGAAAGPFCHSPVSVALGGVRPGIRIFGVEPQGANDTFRSLQAGHRVEVRSNTIADGLTKTLSFENHRRFLN